MILYRHADPRFPFLWESLRQPPARWHDAGEGPVHYLADTPDGAWAEFLRHEGITEENELENVQRALWVIEAPDDIRPIQPKLAKPVLNGGIETYPACRKKARRLREKGVHELKVRSAALVPGGARGWTMQGGLQPAAERDGYVVVLFGARPNLTGWAAASPGRPPADLLRRVQHL